MRDGNREGFWRWKRKGSNNTRQIQDVASLTSKGRCNQIRRKDEDSRNESDKSRILNSRREKMFLGTRRWKRESGEKTHREKD